MIKPLSFYVDKIINDLKEKGKRSKQKGWSMSDIVQKGEYAPLSPEEWYESTR